MEEYYLHEESILCHRWAVTEAPEYGLGYWNLSLALLANGLFEEGWQQYEKRWLWRQFPEPARKLPCTVWRGQSLTDKRIMVWSEQGLGDNIQFVPLIARLCQQAEQVYLEVPATLVRLLQYAFPQVQVIARPDAPHLINLDIAPEYAVPLLSLPHLLKLTVNDLPMARQYVKPNPVDVQKWQPHIAKNTLKVGLVLAGRSAHANDANRSMSAELLKPLFSLNGVSWVSLQVGTQQDAFAEDKYPVQTVHQQLNDFADTAALVACLDIVISVDTSTAHLVGAMEKTLWIMLPATAEWRWRKEEIACKWYPDVRTFRQPEVGDWTSVVHQVKCALEERLALATE